MPWGWLGSLGSALVGVGFFQGCWVHTGAPWGLLGSFSVVGFIRVRRGGGWFIQVFPGGRWVNSGLLECALGVFGFKRVVQVQPDGRSGSFDSFVCVPVDVRFIQGC